MIITTLLTLSVLICLAGLAYRLFTWYSQTLGPDDGSLSLSDRFTQSLKGTFGLLLSSKSIRLVRSFFSDLLFQQRIIKKSSLRWVAHTLIFFGFILLLLMHALESVVSVNLFAGYESTLNPFLFLRNLFGVMVLVGVGLAVYRRLTMKQKRLKSYPSDWLALVLVGGIMVSGMLLEGSQIRSYTIYSSMMEEYGDFEEEEALALEAFWVAENGLSSPNIVGPIPQAQIDAGREANEMSCIECHASNKMAFASFSLKGLTAPVSSAFGDSAALTLFTILHVLFCCALLAWLPFSKMFHVVAAPVSLLVNAVFGKENPTHANALTRQIIGLSACTHCGSCSVECSSNMFYESFQNDFILPSEKIQYLQNIAAGKPVDGPTRKKLQEGLYVCTSCDRCSDICPSGINLRDIFTSARYTLLEEGMPEKTLFSHFSFPLALAQRFQGNHLKALKAVEELFRKTLQKISDLQLPLTLGKVRDMPNESYKSCYSCQRCTNICPVVRSYEDPVQSLDMLPHQLIYSLGTGNQEVAMGSQMIWSCSTCYLCQEHCPNQVELTDIFYKLKNQALKTIDAGEKV